jgi:hypothetical protein
MRSVRFQGNLPEVMAENTAARRWAGAVQWQGDPSQIALIDVVGDADLYIGSSFDPLTGTVLLSNIAMVDYESFTRDAKTPALTIVLRVFFKDGTMGYSDSCWTFGVTNLDDTPPTALAFASGGAVVPGAIGATIGRLAVTDPDSAGPFTFTIGEADAWMYEVVDNSLKLRDGMSVAISDGPYRAINVEVSDGHQSAAFTLNIRVESPASETAILDVLDPWETKAGFSYKSAGVVWAERGAWEVERLEHYGSELTDVVMKDGSHVWLPKLDRLEFLNGAIDMRADGSAALANSLYQTILGRNIDAGSLWQISHALDAKEYGKDQLAAILLNCFEYHMNFGHPSNEQFIRQLYRNVDGSTPAEPDVQGWKHALDIGMSRAEVALNFANMDVTRANIATANPYGLWMDRPNANIVASIYDVALDRLPEHDGFEYWMGVLNAGLISAYDLSKLFGRSTEYIGRFANLNQQDFVRSLYENALGREPDQEGFDYWVGHLNRGTLARSDMISSFGFSTEKQGYLSALPLGEPFN